MASRREAVEEEPDELSMEVISWNEFKPISEGFE
jgi:hypothetical protein